MIEMDISNYEPEHRITWNQLQRNRAYDILKAIAAESVFPIEVRDIYYAMIGAALKSSHWMSQKGKRKGLPMKDPYGDAVVPLVHKMRIEGTIPRGAIIDESRPLTFKIGYSDLQDFIEDERENFLAGYNRCVAQGQPVYLEIWVEKNGAVRKVQMVTDRYCRRVLGCHGFSSLGALMDFETRALKAHEQSQRVVILYLGDWDPSGELAPYAFTYVLKKELGLDFVEVHRIGLNPDQLKLAQVDPFPPKPNDSRTKKFISEHGTKCFELNSLSTEKLQLIVTESIEAFTDIEVLETNRQIGDGEEKKINVMREKICNLLDEIVAV